MAGSTPVGMEEVWNDLGSVAAADSDDYDD
jgi:hypothetical protein